MSMSERATSFGTAASSYEAGRPDYPFEAVAWMLERLPEGGRRVADVGAGTGKLTRVLAEAAEGEVVAVDPDAEMLAALHVQSPQVPTFVGTAESLPLPDASVDAVVLGQAWHWVDPVPASAEIGRVVRPGGVLGLIWNVRDERYDWVRRLTLIMSGSPAEEMISGDGPTIAAPFAGVESRRWEWTRTMTREQLLHMARSRSYIITASEEKKASIERGMHDLFDELGVVGDRTIDLPYVTAAFRAVRG
ncbi:MULTISPECIES: class I SAM-dependent methyltransferase [unclassified Microbacterium]|uniref:class I SAM-dependent methyltransferase n=1 Tax=unclassified Microbacterium TaxID=2609290 RepID=UPI0012FA8A9D|nr:class I SAM-dependent methyltransferase [Microbacterium sp. MAH-37]MVQ41964.1 methyltransferase domain-containing protein [Microbacterium sp. MAH-37]